MNILEQAKKFRDSLPENVLRRRKRLLRDVLRYLQFNEDVPASLVKRVKESISSINKQIDYEIEKRWQIKLSLYPNESEYCCGEGCKHCGHVGYNKNRQYYEVREEYQAYLQKKKKRQPK